MADITRALHHRNYRLYFFGQLVSLAGTWMQQIAMSWLAYRLTGSNFILGLIGFCSLIPLLPLAPFGGVLADRFDKRRILLLTQSLFLLQALVLAALALSGAVQAWHLVGLSLLMGFVNAVEIPTRQSFVVLMVEDRADLPNAIALNSVTFNAARLVGPALGGFLVGQIGEGACFLINAASFLAVIFALSSMRTRHEPRLHASPIKAIHQALLYLRTTPEIRTLLLYVMMTSFFLMPYQVLIPHFAKTVYGGDAHTFGLLMAAGGAGALFGVLYLAARQNVAGLERAIGRAGLGAALCLAAFALSDRFWLGIFTLLPLGLFTFYLLASCNTLIQSLVQDDMRGRITSLYAMALAGVAPLGSLATGWLAEYCGARVTLVGAAAVSLAATLFYLKAENTAAAR